MAVIGRKQKGLPMMCPAKQALQGDFKLLLDVIPCPHSYENGNHIK